MNITYGSFIAEERVAVGDTLKYAHDEQVGDGVTTLLLSADSPIGTTTLTVKQAGTVLPESTGASFYTVDYQRGAITFSTAPASGATITLDYQRAVLANSTWARITNDAVLMMTGEFWKETYNTGSTTTVAYQKTYTMPADCIDLLNVWVSATGGSNDPYKTMTTLGYNWRYARDSNELVFGDPYPNGGEYFQFHYLQAYGTANPDGDLSGTIDVQERYKPALQYAVREKYWQYRLQEKVNITTAVSVERTTLPVQNLILVADYWHNKYLETKKQLKPAKPPHRLPRYVEGRGNP